MITRLYLGHQTIDSNSDKNYTRSTSTRYHNLADKTTLSDTHSRMVYYSITFTPSYSRNSTCHRSILIMLAAFILKIDGYLLLVLFTSGPRGVYGQHG